MTLREEDDHQSENTGIIEEVMGFLPLDQAEYGTEQQPQCNQKRDSGDMQAVAYEKSHEPQCHYNDDGKIDQLYI